MLLDASGELDACLELLGVELDVVPDVEEHPAVAMANTQVSPAIGFRTLRIEHAPLLMASVSGWKQTRIV
ncbi:hypothetical protein ACIQOU_21215 [Streptomyces sp. NPDC091279]|uniref:hypothetical protein n=1 Tax=unclassified Streptomyces TaxID=2593676 RepID=UPI003827EDED